MGVHYSKFALVPPPSICWFSVPKTIEIHPHLIILPYGQFNAVYYGMPINFAQAQTCLSEVLETLCYQHHNQPVIF